MYSVTQVCRYDSETEVYPWSTLFPTLDEAKAEEAKKRAEEALRNQDASMDYAVAQAELVSAVAQLAAIRKLRAR